MDPALKRWAILGTFGEPVIVIQPDRDGTKDEDFPKARSPSFRIIRVGESKTPAGETGHSYNPVRRDTDVATITSKEGQSNNMALTINTNTAASAAAG